VTCTQQVEPLAISHAAAPQHEFVIFGAAGHAALKLFARRQIFIALLAATTASCLDIHDTSGAGMATDRPGPADETLGHLAMAEPERDVGFEILLLAVLVTPGHSFLADCHISVCAGDRTVAGKPRNTLTSSRLHRAKWAMLVWTTHRSSLDSDQHKTRISPANKRKAPALASVLTGDVLAGRNDGLF
jgi:hypothetical protein